jgi:tetratricopeptide (TPR) repeat protein
VQDWMIIEIINSNNWGRPVYFAVTVSEDNKLGLDEYMTMEGMAFRVYPQKVTASLDVEKTRHNLYDVYKYRGLTDPNVYKDDNSQRLLYNYNAAYFQLALKYANELNRPDEAIKAMARADSLIGVGWRGYYLMSEIYSKMGKSQEAIDKLNLVLKERPQEVGVYMNLGGLYYGLGKFNEAVAAYEKVLAIKPNMGQAYEMLERLYLGQKQFGKITQLINRWLAINPNDDNARKRLAAYQGQIQANAGPTQAIPGPAVKKAPPQP